MLFDRRIPRWPCFVLGAWGCDHRMLTQDAAGWEGTEVTPQIRTLIEDHHLGAILLTTKNLKSIVTFHNLF